MNIYLLKRSDTTPGLVTQTSALVVIAESVEDALNVPKTAAGPDWRYWWTLNDDKVAVILVGESHPLLKRGVLLASGPVIPPLPQPSPGSELDGPRVFKSVIP